MKVWLRYRFRWLAWRRMMTTAVWLYQENIVTGQRRAIWRGSGYQPVDDTWLRRGDIVHGPHGRFVID
jgi:hypothetical protein